MAKRGADHISPIQKFAKKHKGDDNEESLLDQISSVIFTVRDDLLKGQALAVSSLREEIAGLRTDITGELSEVKVGLTQVSDVVEQNRLRLDELEQRVAFLEDENKQLKFKQVDSENKRQKKQPGSHWNSRNSE